MNVASIRAKLLWALAALLAGWTLGQRPSSDAPALVQARRDAWTLPVLGKPADTPTRAAIVAAAPQWGVDKTPAAGAAAEEAPRWRLAGIYGAGKSGGVLVLYEGDRKPAERLKVGDKLPTGHIIESVDGNQIHVRLGKKRESFGVENRE